MMKSKTFYLTSIFIFLFAFNSLYAGKDKPEYAVRYIPEKLKEEAHTVYRDIDITIEVDDTRSYRYTEKKVITLLSGKSNETSQGTSFDPDRKIKDFEVNIYDAEGKHIRKVRKDEIEDVSYVSEISIYEDTRLYYVDVSRPTFPYTVEYLLEYEEKNFYGFPTIVFQSNNHCSVQSAQYSLICPEDYKINYRFTESMLNFTQDVIDGSRVYQWSYANEPAHDTKTFESMSMIRAFPIVMAVPEIFEVEGRTGSNENWQEWGKYFYELNKDRTDISDDMRKVVHNLKAESSDSEELIQRLYKYLQDNNRYVSVQLGIGGYQTYPASYVEERQYGDCKALSNFMKSLLEEAGIPAHLTIAHLGSSQEFYEDFPAFYSFNHMILYVPEEDMFLECTSSDAPPGYVGASNHNKSVVVLTAEGGQVKRIEPPSTAENLRESETEVWIDYEGNARVAFEAKAYHEEQELYRALTNYPTSDVKDYIQRSSRLPAFTFEDMNVSADPLKPEAELSFVVQSDKFAVKAGPRMFVPLNPTSPFESYANVDELKFKYEKKSGNTRKNTFIYHIPDGYAVESLPDSETIRNEKFGYLEMNLTQEEGKIIFERTLFSPPFSIVPSEYEELKKFLKKLEKADKQKFVLVANKP